MSLRRALVLALALAPAVPGCAGSGSEVGPELPDLPEGSLSGAVVDPTGAPVSDAEVTLLGRATFTDRRGRFRFEGNFGGAGLLRIDARRTTTNTATPAILDALDLAISFPGGNAILDRAVALPSFTAGASASISVNQGAPLAGTLVDPATGAELVLTGAVATHPDAAATSATIRFASVPADAIPAALTVGGVVRAGALYFAIAPAELGFTTPPVVRVSDATFGIAAAIANAKTVTPELDRLVPGTGVWTLAGTAAVGGGFLSSPDVAGGGLHALSVESPPSRRTLATGRVIDRSLLALARAGVLARDGRAALADTAGGFAIPDVCAADADDAPLPVAVSIVAPAYYAQHALRRDVLPGSPGGVTAFLDRPLATTPAGRARVLAVFKGVALPGARTGVASFQTGLADLQGISTVAGVEFWDVPIGQIQVAVIKVLSGVTVARGTGFTGLPAAGSTVDLIVFPLAGALPGLNQSGVVFAHAVRAASGAPLPASFGLVGVDPIAGQQGFSPSGFFAFSALLPGGVLSTVGRATEVPGIGTPADLIRRTAYSSILSASTSVRPRIALDLDLAPSGFDAAARWLGPATGLTDPAAQPPVSGAYTLEARAHASGTFEERIGVALGAEPEPGGSIPATAIAPTFANPSYETLAPAGAATIVVVERDATSALGPITKLGFAAAVDAPFGTTKTLPIALDVAPGLVGLASFDGFTGNPALVRARVVLGMGNDQGIDVGDQGAMAFVPVGSSHTLLVAVPPTDPLSLASGVIQRVAAVVSDAGVTANGSTFARSAAMVIGDPGNGVFLAPPELAAPAPPPGQPIVVSPTGAGVSWTADPATDETVLRVVRAGVISKGSGQVVDERFEWEVTLPTMTPGAPPSSFVFPSLPPNSAGQAVPPFFQSGAVYTLTLEARRHAAFDEKAKAAAADAVRPSFFRVRSSSRTETTIAVQ